MYNAKKGRTTVQRTCFTITSDITNIINPKLLTRGRILSKFALSEARKKWGSVAGGTLHTLFERHRQRIGRRLIEGKRGR